MTDLQWRRDLSDGSKMAEIMNNSCEYRRHCRDTFGRIDSSYYLRHFQNCFLHMRWTTINPGIFEKFIDSIFSISTGPRENMLKMYDDQRSLLLIQIPFYKKIIIPNSNCSF